VTRASKAPRAPPRLGSANRLAATLAIAAQTIAAWMGNRDRVTGRSSVCLIVMSAQLRGQRTARCLRARSPSEFGAQLFGNEVRIDAVADDLRPDEDDELGADRPVGAVREGAAERARQFVEQRDAGAAALLTLANETGHEHGLAAGDGNRALDL